MSRDGNDSVPSRQNNFSLLCFRTISFRAGSHIHIRQREKLEYFLLNFLQKRRLTPLLLQQIHRVCRYWVSRTHRKVWKIWRQLRSLPEEFLFLETICEMDIIITFHLILARCNHIIRGASRYKLFKLDSLNREQQMSFCGFKAEKKRARESKKWNRLKYYLSHTIL